MSRVQRTRDALPLIAAAILLSTLPSIAHACPVCFSAQNEENRFAFVAMTVFLTLLPLAMLGLGMGWAWRRMRALEERSPEQAAARDTVGDRPPAVRA